MRVRVFNLNLEKRMRCQVGRKGYRCVRQRGRSEQNEKALHQARCRALRLTVG